MCYVINTMQYVVFLTNVQVTKDKLWNEIAQLFYQKHDVLNAGYLLKQHYIRYLTYNNCNTCMHVHGSYSDLQVACVLIHRMKSTLCTLDCMLIFNFYQLLWF